MAIYLELISQQHVMDKHASVDIGCEVNKQWRLGACAINIVRGFNAYNVRELVQLIGFHSVSLVFT